MRNRLILWLVLLLIGFLAGFVPQYLKAQRTYSELSANKQQLSTCQLNGRLSHLRDSAALLYLEATRKNYGLAAEHSTRLFDEARQLAEQTPDPALRSSLQEILKSRDAITSALANGDPAVIPDLQSLLTKTERDLNR